MDNLKKDILEITKETKTLSSSQLIRLLFKHNVGLDRKSYDEIYSFLQENKISLRNSSSQSNTTGSKEYILAK